MLFTSSNTHEIHHIDRTYRKQKEGVKNQVLYLNILNNLLNTLNKGNQFSFRAFRPNIIAPFLFRFI